MRAYLYIQIEKKVMVQNEICIAFEVGYLLNFLPSCFPDNPTQLVTGWAQGEESHTIQLSEH